MTEADWRDEQVQRAELMRLEYLRGDPEPEKGTADWLDWQRAWMASPERREIARLTAEAVKAGWRPEGGSLDVTGLEKDDYLLRQAGGGKIKRRPMKAARVGG